MRNVARREAFLQPARALGAGAVVEGFGRGAAIGLLLEVVVADFGCRVEGFLNVAVFERAEHLVVVVGPHAGEEVGLQFEAHAHFVRFGCVAAILRHLLVRLTQNAEFVLHMVAHLVGDDVGVGKVAVGPKLLAHAAEERQVDVQALVGRAVERTHLGAALSAAGACATSV